MTTGGGGGGRMDGIHGIWHGLIDGEQQQEAGGSTQQEHVLAAGARCQMIRLGVGVGLLLATGGTLALGGGGRGGGGSSSGRLLGLALAERLLAEDLL